MRLLSVFLIVAACQSANHISFGPEVESAVQQVLDAPQEGEAALSTGRAVYWVPKSVLQKERDALMAALRETPFTPTHEHLEAEIPHDVEVVFTSDDRVVAWLRSEVFEARYDEGTLHVERHEFPGDKPHFRVSLIQDKRVLYAGAKSGLRIENAWRRLSGAAMKRSTLKIDGTTGSHDRPLESMRHIGIDFRGVAEVDD